MKPMTAELRTRVAAALKAMAHPTRLLLIEALAQGERCVCELTPLTGADVSTVSKHLALLRTAGLVHRRKQELNVYYSLAGDDAARIIGIMRAGVKTDLVRALKAV